MYTGLTQGEKYLHFSIFTIEMEIFSFSLGFSETIETQTLIDDSVN